VPRSFICNFSDLLDWMMCHQCRSTPLPLRNPAPHYCLSLPHFFNPNYFAWIQPIDLPGRHAAAADWSEC